MTVQVLLGKDAQRDEVTAFLSRPEFLAAYSRPGRKPLAEREAMVASIEVVPWEKTLVSGLRKHFASDANRTTARAALRYGRVDRAVFVYPEGGGGLQLRFEGVVLQTGNAGLDSMNRPLRDESKRLFPPPIPQFSPQNSLTEFPNPVQLLQSKVTADPKLDGVYLKDLSFGPEGEPTFEGLWAEPKQKETLDIVLTPFLAEKTRGKVLGPLSWAKMKETPTYRLLRNLRGKVAAEFSEASLDRFFFRNADGPEPAPELVLQAAVLAPDKAKLEQRLETWLKEDELLKTVGAPVVKEFTTRPNSLVAELRTLVVSDQALDGVLVDRGVFDEENVFVLSGLQDHQGQAKGVENLIRKAAAKAWGDLPPPAKVEARTFKLFPLLELLERISRKLPEHEEADGVILTRAYYNDESALVLTGRGSGPEGDPAKLENLIRKLIGDESKLIGDEIDLKLDKVVLERQPRDLKGSEQTVIKGVAALVAGNLGNFPIEKLDEAIFLNPLSSTAWYLRGAYYLDKGNQEFAQRDLWRVHVLEPTPQSSQAAERSSYLVNFQGDRRRTLDDMVESAKRPNDRVERVQEGAPRGHVPVGRRR